MKGYHWGMINDLLVKLGFTEKEILVYLAVLENGKISPAVVSTLTNIKRPTVYSVGKELIKRGVITEDTQGSGSYFVALPPENLVEAIKKEELIISEKKQVIKELMGELENLPRSKSYSVPKMRFIDEYNIRDFMYKQAPVWDQSMIQSQNHTWWGFQDHTFVENKDLQEWIAWYWTRSPKEINLKLISNDTQAEKEMQEKKFPGRYIKFWKKGFNFTTTNWIVGDYVVFTMTRQRPNYIVEIHDAVYAENMRQVFKNLWDIIDVNP
ncbi:MAG: helix-turn-helix domain-containing protein [Candidatus Paceibacterota bacterium]